MTEIEKSVARIMSAPVSGLVRLSDREFDTVMSLVYAARLSRPYEVKPVEIKRKVKHGKKSR